MTLTDRIPRIYPAGEWMAQEPVSDLVTKAKQRRAAREAAAASAAKEPEVATAAKVVEMAAAAMPTTPREPLPPPVVGTLEACNERGCKFSGEARWRNWSKFARTSHYVGERVTVLLDRQGVIRFMRNGESAGRRPVAKPSRSRIVRSIKQW
jgi:hypothetical protein